MTAVSTAYNGKYCIWTKAKNGIDAIG